MSKMTTGEIKGEDHYKCRELKAERDALRREVEALKKKIEVLKEQKTNFHNKLFRMAIALKMISRRIERAAAATILEQDDE